jgi:hypothetical protein
MPQIRKSLAVLVALLPTLQPAFAQTFQRLGTCPTLGCILPPDQSDFYPGQYFDVRVEVHAPVNGSEAFNDGKVDEKFSLCIQEASGYDKRDEDNDLHGNGGHDSCEDADKFFEVKEPQLEKWNFK